MIFSRAGNSNKIPTLLFGFDMFSKPRKQTINAVLLNFRHKKALPK